MWGHWYPLFQTSDESAHEFQIQGGSVVACALLSLACNDSKSHLWLPGPGIEPGSLAPEASTIPLCQPDLALDAQILSAAWFGVKINFETTGRDTRKCQGVN